MLSHTAVRDSFLELEIQETPYWGTDTDSLGKRIPKSFVSLKKYALIEIYTAYFEGTKNLLHTNWGFTVYAISFTYMCYT